MNRALAMIDTFFYFKSNRLVKGSTLRLTLSFVTRSVHSSETEIRKRTASFSYWRIAVWWPSFADEKLDRMERKNRVEYVLNEKTIGFYRISSMTCSSSERYSIVLNDELVSNYSSTQMDFSLALPDRSLTMSWEHLDVGVNVTPPSRSRTTANQIIETNKLLLNVFGHVVPGQILAIMGSSGAGKIFMLLPTIHSDESIFRKDDTAQCLKWSGFFKSPRIRDYLSQWPASRWYVDYRWLRVMKKDHFRNHTSQCLWLHRTARFIYRIDDCPWAFDLSSEKQRFSSIWISFEHHLSFSNTRLCFACRRIPINIAMTVLLTCWKS